MKTKISPAFVNSIEEWLSSKRLSENTVIYYRNLANKYAVWIEQSGNHPKTVSVRTVKDWIMSLEISSSYKYQLGIFARQFSVWKYGAKHPLSNLRIFQEDPGPQRTLNQSQVETLMNSFKDTPPGIRNRALVSLLIDTGLRATEVCRLQLANVNLEKNSLKAYCKGGKWLTKVFSERTADYLREWLKTRSDIDPDCDNLFISVYERNPLSRNGLRVIFRRMGEAAGLGLISPHDMRRTMATLAIRNGAPTLLVAKQGGWSDLKLVERYAQALQAEDFAPFFAMGTK